MPNVLPDLELLDSLFVYNPETGELTNRKSRGRAKAGSPAGSNQGIYRQVCVEGKKYLLHRLAYAMFYRVDPGEYVVDHIDRNTSNNRADNLRLTTQHINTQNCERTENASHYYAVRGKRGTRYRARFTHNGTVYWCGTHATPELATASALAKKDTL